jgi:hypothetical protein
MATLVYIYGPPAVGKLTIARRLSARTGLPLFHNHLSVDAVASVFPFGGEPFSKVLHRFRLDTFETAAAEGLSLIFTNNSAWRGPDARSRFAAFAAEADRRVTAAGGRILFVQLTAPPEVLEGRLGSADRHELGKLTDAERLRELLGGLDQSPLNPSDLCIDTSTTGPDAAAAVIARALGETGATS